MISDRLTPAQRLARDAVLKVLDGRIAAKEERYKRAQEELAVVLCEVKPYEHQLARRAALQKQLHDHVEAQHDQSQGSQVYSLMASPPMLASINSNREVGILREIAKEAIKQLPVSDRVTGLVAEKEKLDAALGPAWVHVNKRNDLDNEITYLNWEIPSLRKYREELASLKKVKPLANPAACVA
jgi:hypothetical protein